MATCSTSLFRNLGALLTTVALATLAQPALAQNPGSSSPSGSLSLPRPDFHFKGEIGRTYQDSDPATFPQIVRPPKGAPNVVLILLDDVGFGQFSVFGGGVSSPNMEKLATQGLRYNRFHTTALCSPTRAALLCGRNHHVTGNGSITEAATGYDGYTGIIPKSAGTVGEVLRQNGYATAWVGKNHPRLGNQRDRSVRPLGQWTRLRLFLRLQFRGHEPVRADPLREPQSRPAVERSELSPFRRHHRPCDRLDAEGEGHRSRQAVLSLCRSGCNPLAAPGTEGMDRQVQRPVRHGLGPLPRNNIRASEAAWRHSSDRKPHGATSGPPSLGHAQRRPETYLCTHDGSVRRLRRACRSRDGARAGRGGEASGRRQHADPLSRRR
jgi:hypothetical protein